MPRSSSPKPTFSATVRHGSSANCWNTIAMRLVRSIRKFVGAAMGDVDRAVAVSDQHLAARDLVEPVDGAQDRRLARAREAHQHADLALFDREVDARRAEHGAGRLEDFVARLALVDQRQRLARACRRRRCRCCRRRPPASQALPLRSGLRQTRSSTIASSTIEIPASMPIGMLTVRARARPACRARPRRPAPRSPPSTGSA